MLIAITVHLYGKGKFNLVCVQPLVSSWGSDSNVGMTSTGFDAQWMGSTSDSTLTCSLNSMLRYWCFSFLINKSELIAASQPIFSQGWELIAMTSVKHLLMTMFSPFDCL